jgi:hypothetical protein
MPWRDCPDCREISVAEVELCEKHWDELQEHLRLIREDD